MLKISYIKASNDDKLLLLGIIEEGESRHYTISYETYASIGSPEARTEIGEQEMAAIRYADELYRAEKKALSLLAFADNNVRALRQKLIRAGFSRDVSEQICTKMISIGYINESRQLERIILSEANGKLRGPLKIMPYVVSKGYSSTEARRIIQELCDGGEIDFDKNAELLLAKKLPDDATDEDRKKLLYRNGYKIC